MRKLLLTDQPLYLPAGSIRSILALAVVTAFIIGVAPIEVATLVLGFYFAARQGDTARDAELAERVRLSKQKLEDI